ncbi:MAG: hypothetical protein AAF849_08660 [Bacteroidota bacterium]
MEQELDIKYIQIAELSQNIERLNEIIQLHQQTTRNQSMIRQYQFKRQEFIEELKSMLESLQLRVSLAMAS